MHVHNKVLATVAALAFSTAAGAESFALKEGLWKVDREMSNSVKKTPETGSADVCLKAGAFDPMRELLLPGGCETADREESATDLSWSFTCGGGGMPASQGKGSFTTDGDTARGQMEMTASYSDQTVTIYQKWTGRYLGADCEPKAAAGAGM